MLKRESCKGTHEHTLVNLVYARPRAYKLKQISSTTKAHSFITFCPLEGLTLCKPKNLVMRVFSYLQTWLWYFGSILSKTYEVATISQKQKDIKKMATAQDIWQTGINNTSRHGKRTKISFYARELFLPNQWTIWQSNNSNKKHFPNLRIDNQVHPGLCPHVLRHHKRKKKKTFSLGLFVLSPLFALI